MKACPHCQSSYPTNYTHCPRDGTPLLEGQAWREGMTIRGKYRILCKIGEGGMAVVYKAMHTRFEELRALKVMNSELSGDQAFVRRFMHEAVLTRKLQHANAVRVEDIDEADDGRPFIVMEYIEGRSLKDVIQSEAPISPLRVCSIAAQVAGALDAAHRLGIIHRDIKPANIFLVNASGGPEIAKVLDFGIAKAKEGSSEDGTLSHSTLTGAGSIIGTPAYMSPEQARGLRGEQLDGRSDLYSLGVVMYEMLINGLPLKADTSVQWILAHAHTPPKPLWEARPDLQIPPAVAALVMRCLAKNPMDRPESAYRLIEEIRQSEQGWVPGRTRVFSSAAPDVWASGLGAAPSMASAAPEITTPERARGSSQLMLPPVQAQSPGRWAAWGASAGFVVLIAAVISFWLLKRPAATPATTREAPAASSATVSNATSPAEAPASTSTAANPPSDGTPASQVMRSSETVSTDSTNLPASTVVETGRDNPDAAPAGNASESSRRKALRDKNQAEILAKSRQFAQALLQAKNAENDGRFEDALREYEWASTLEPSDTALKRHIKQLRDRIAKENELIH